MSALRRAGLAAAVTITLGSASLFVMAQPAPPTVSAKATPPPSATPKASAAPKASGSAGALASAAPSGSALADASALPNASAAPSASASAPPGDPHAGLGGGMDPHGGHGHGDPRNGGDPGGIPRFEPPKDQNVEDPELPPGTIILTVVDKDERAVPGLAITMKVDHSSVAKGDTHEQLEGKTDEMGEVRFDGLKFGSAHTYWLRAAIGEAVYATRPIQLGQNNGGRGLLHVYDATEDRSLLRIGLQTEVRTSLKDDVIVVEQEYRLDNYDPVSWVADVEVPLPPGFKAFQTPSDSGTSPLRVLQTDRGAVLRGTVPPGASGVAFGYHIPLTGEADQEFDIEPFPATVAVVLNAEASRKMSLTADKFGPAQFAKEDGVTKLMTRRIDENGIGRFKLGLHGLPTRGAGGYIAVVLAVIALGATIAYRWSRKGKRALEPETVQELTEARDTLVDEIRALEAAHAKGLVGPKTYERSRALLVDALSRIMGRIEGSAAPPARTS